MRRKEIEQLMKSQGLKQIDLIMNKDDELAIYCKISGNYLKDYMDRTIDRTKDIWGYLKWQNGKSIRIAFEGE